MKTKVALFGLTLSVAIVGSVYVAYQRGMQQGVSMNTASVATVTATVDDPSLWSVSQGEEATRRHLDAGIKAGDIDPVTGLQVQHYYDPMMPASKFDAPGKSPFMDMMLVPAYGGSTANTQREADIDSLSISTRRQQNTGMRSSAVVVGSLAPRVSATGVIVWNEREQIIMQARAQAFVEKLYVRATGDFVTQHQALAELYVPDWLAVQEEFIVLTHLQSGSLASLQAAAKTRMRQAGMNEAQIQRVVTSGTVQPIMTINAAIAGVVSELAVREGMTVMAGATLFRLNGTTTVWAEVEVPESQAAGLQVGDLATAITPSLPGVRFKGKIQSLLPLINPELRTRKARLELANATGQLVPGMLIQMELSASAKTEVLLIPTESIIDTGSRTVVMLDEGEGNFRPVEVTIGTESAGLTEIISGLQVGQKVVTSGQFLLDSEANLHGLEARFAPEAQTTTGATP
jgi:membrane fusion protein, copper/silver efflux system